MAWLEGKIIFKTENETEISNDVTARFTKNYNTRTAQYLTKYRQLNNEGWPVIEYRV